MAVATYEDVAVALGRPITLDTEQAQVEWWLSGIELIIGYRLGDIAELDQDLLKFVEVEAVVGKVRRSDSRVTSRTVSIDDGSVTDRFETSASVADITDEWWQLLRTGVLSIWGSRSLTHSGLLPVDRLVGWLVEQGRREDAAAVVAYARDLGRPVDRVETPEGRRLDVPVLDPSTVAPQALALRDTER